MIAVVQRRTADLSNRRINRLKAYGALPTSSDTLQVGFKFFGKHGIKLVRLFRWRSLSFNLFACLVNQVRAFKPGPGSDTQKRGVNTAQRCEPFDGGINPTIKFDVR